MNTFCLRLRFLDEARELNEFEQFYQSHVRVVYAAALAGTASTGAAEDAAQETLLQAWRHFDTLRPLDIPAQRAWLLRTLRNRSVDLWRRDKSDRQEPLHEAADRSRENPCSRDYSEEQRNLMRLEVTRALAQLSPSDRELVVLRYFCEMNSREIGEMLAIPESTIRRRLSLCREALAEQLAVWQTAGGEKE
jgi:RNA polymerase sigma-70 factor (ECF subfamily)